MPFSDDAIPAGLAPLGAREIKTETQAAPFGKLLDAAMFTQNSLGSLAESISFGPQKPMDPNVDPWADIVGYEDYAAAFSDVRDSDDITRIKGRIDTERLRADMLYSNGAMGMVAAVIAGMLDPINLTPIGGSAVMVGRAGTSALSGALRVGRMGLGFGLLTESALQSTQYTRSWEESAINVAGQTFLSGLLGGAVGAVAGRGSTALESMSKGMFNDADNVAADIAANLPEAAPPPVRLSGVSLARSPKYESDIPYQNGHYYRIIGEGGLSDIEESGVIRASPSGKGQYEAAYFEKNHPNRIYAKRGAESVIVEVAPNPKIVEETGHYPRTIEGSELTKDDPIRIWKRRDDGTYSAIYDNIKQQSAHTVGPGASGGSIGAASAARSLETESIARLGSVPEWMAFSAPTLSTQTSPVVATRVLSQELAEQPLMTKGNIEGVPSPTAVESLIRQWNYPLAKGLSEAENLFVQYRLGADKMPVGNLARIGATDMLRMGGGKLDRQTFMEEVGKAMRQGDEHEIPEVAAAARHMRKTVFDPLKDRAIELGMLPEGVDPGTSASYLMRQYNHRKIAAERNDFTDRLASWYASEQTKKADIQSRVKTLADDLNDWENRVRRTEGSISTRESSISKVETRQDEISRLRRFAYQRSEKLSEPLDALNQTIKDITKTIAPTLSKMEELADLIKAEKDAHPEIRAIESTMWKLIAANRKLAEGKDIIDLVEGIEDYAKAIDSMRGGFAEGIKSASQQAKYARVALGLTDLVELEKARADLGKEIRPYRKTLAKAKKDYAATRSRRVPGARGGAVFESKIIERGNKLSDQVMGRNATIDNLREKLGKRQAKANELRAELESALGEWHGKSTKGLKGALERRTQAEADRLAKATASGKEAPSGRLTGADRDVMSAARRILAADTRMSVEDLRDVARQTVDRILGTPAGRLPYDVSSPSPGFMRVDDTPDIKAGALKQRVLMIPDELIEDYLVSDISQVARAYVHTMAPDVEMAGRGWLDFDSKIKAITEQYEVLRRQDPSQSADLQKRMEKDIRNIKAIWERLRGEYALPADPDALITRTFRVMRDLNYLRLLGGMTLSALPDVGGVVMQHGMMRLFRNGIVPAVSNWRTFRMAAEEVKMTGEALDMVLDTRAMSLADVMDDYGRHSKFERGIKAMTSQFGIVSLMAPWNSALKQLTGIISQTRSLQAIEALAAGTIDAAERTRLAQFGIGDDEARAIGRQFAEHGEKHGSLWWANTNDWTDRSAVEVYRAAMSKEINKVIVTPGQEKPLWMSTEAGKTIGQFKSFAFSSMQRTTLAAIQRRDANVVQGAALMTGLGMLAYYFKTDHDKLADDPGVWVKEGIDRSGLTGWMFELNNMVEKATWGEVGLSRLTGQPMSSRYASRNWLGSLLGPSADLVGGVQKVTGAATSGEWDETATREMRRMLPMQNLIGFRLAVDRAEEGINNAFGIPMKGR